MCVQERGGEGREEVGVGTRGMVCVKQKTADEIEYGLVGTEMCIRDRKPSEPNTPIKPKESGRIRGESQDGTGFKPESDSGSLAVKERPTVQTSKPIGTPSQGKAPVIKPQKLYGHDTVSYTHLNTPTRRVV